MIDFANGIIALGSGQISAKMRIEDLNGLESKGSIKRTRNGTSGQVSFYAENVLHENMRFALGIRCNGNRIDWMSLRWLDGPCTSRGWDSANLSLLKDEYAQLMVFLETEIGNPPDRKKSRECIWLLPWGRINISYDTRACEVGVFLEPG